MLKNLFFDGFVEAVNDMGILAHQKTGVEETPFEVLDLREGIQADLNLVTNPIYVYLNDGRTLVHKFSLQVSDHSLRK